MPGPPRHNAPHQDGLSPPPGWGRSLEAMGGPMRPPAGYGTRIGPKPAPLVRSLGKIKQNLCRATRGASFRLKNKKHLRPRTVTHAVNRPGRTSTNVFEKPINSIIWFSIISLTSRGVTGSIPVAPPLLSMTWDFGQTGSATIPMSLSFSWRRHPQYCVTPAFQISLFRDRVSRETANPCA
jgi:hypothetical protein